MSGVGGGGAFAGGRDGPTGFGAIGTRGLDAKNGTHDGWIVTGGGSGSRGGFWEAIEYRGNRLRE
jgi:hypothetical protein